jgi:hypothetical protein
MPVKFFTGSIMRAALQPPKWQMLAKQGFHALKRFIWRPKAEFKRLHLESLLLFIIAFLTFFRNVVLAKRACLNRFNGSLWYFWI